MTETASRTDVAADAALVVAAVARMQAADQEARDRLARLHTGLREMADAIGRAKAAAAPAGAHDGIAKTVDIAAMLDEFEHLVDGLIEVAAGPAGRLEPAVASTAAESTIELLPPVEWAPVPEPEAAALIDPEQVPTVSGVVSRLDPEPDVAPPPASDLHEIAVAHAAAGPSVEMLKSLVEALNASIPAEALAMEPMAGRAETAQAAQIEDAEPAATPGEPPAFDVVVTVEPAEPQPEATADEPAAEQPLAAAAAVPAEAEVVEAPAPAISASGDEAGHEVELWARFERMGDVPVLPPELGAVVIFPPHDTPVEAAVEPAGPQHDPAAAELVAEAPAGAGAAAQASEAQASQAQDSEAQDSEAQDSEAQDSEAQDSEAQASQAQAIEEQTAELPPVDLDAAFDPDVCLFGSDDEDGRPADPAEAVEAPADVNDGAAPPPALVAVKPAASPDPLLPIKAMSQEERIALFS